MLAGLAVVAALAFATAGCGLGAGEARPSPTPKSPKDALLASVTELQKTPFTFTVKDASLTGEGAADPAATSGTFKIKVSDDELNFTLNFEFLLIKENAWVKIDFGPAAEPLGLGAVQKKWLHVDKSKVKDADDLGLGGSADPAGSAEIFGAASAVEKVGDRQYRGTVDLTDAKAKDAGMVDEDIVTELGDQAKAVPFEATVDEQGRLVSLKILVPASGKVKAQTWEVTYSGYGTALNLTAPPAAEVVEAPSTLYDIFNA